MEIRRVGVIGAGQMGLGVAQATARAGFETVLAKATPGSLDGPRGKVEKLLAKEVEKGKLTAADSGAMLDRLKWTTNLGELAKVDLIVESIVEELPTKQELFKSLDSIVQPEAIFTSNTSTLCIAEIASAVSQKRQERFLGFHFFNPVHAMKLVEVVATFRTAPDVLPAAIDFAKKVGKVPVVVSDSTGFIVNRLLVPYMVDAIAVLQRGVAGIAEIDAAMQNGAGHPMGPLALTDLIGLDIVFHMATNLQEEYREARFAPPPLLRRMVLSGLLGRKSGSGFYDYGKNPATPNDWLVRGR